MARKKKHGAHENHERWLVSYADFITLLFAFFVVMFATSQTDKGKAQQVSESVKKALEEGQVASAIAGILGGSPDDKGKGSAQMKGPGGVDRAAPTSEEPRVGRHLELVPAMDFLNRELAAELKSGKMQISMQARGLVVSFQQAAFFPSGTDEVALDTMGIIEKVAAVITQLPNPVRLEGHTDAVPIHNGRFKSNWELSAARSIAIMELLAGRFAVPGRRISIAGYAENVPVASNDTDQGRARNRRVDIVILNEVGMQGEPVAADAANTPAAADPSKTTAKAKAH